MAGRLQVIEAERPDVESRLGKLYEALETSALTLEALVAPHPVLRYLEEQLQAAREEAEGLLEQRRVELPGTEEIKGMWRTSESSLSEGTFPERKALIRNFVKGIEVSGDEAVLT